MLKVQEYWDILPYLQNFAVFVMIHRGELTVLCSLIFRVELRIYSLLFLKNNPVFIVGLPVLQE